MGHRTWRRMRCDAPVALDHDKVSISALARHVQGLEQLDDAVARRCKLGLVQQVVLQRRDAVRACRSSSMLALARSKERCRQWNAGSGP